MRGYKDDATVIATAVAAGVPDVEEGQHGDAVHALAFQVIGVCKIVAVDQLHFGRAVEDGAPIVAGRPRAFNPQAAEARGRKGRAEGLVAVELDEGDEVRV